MPQATDAFKEGRLVRQLKRLPLRERGARQPELGRNRARRRRQENVPRLNAPRLFEALHDNRYLVVLLFDVSCRRRPAVRAIQDLTRRHERNAGVRAVRGCPILDGAVPRTRAMLYPFHFRHQPLAYRGSQGRRRFARSECEPNHAN
jgi:hypothetical protein